MRFILSVLFFSLLLNAQNLPKDALYLKGASKNAIILAHGKGQHPKFKVVEPLRIALNEDLDFHTVSLQMPKQHKNYEAYDKEQDYVNEMINKTVVFLKENGVENIYLAGHSLGAGMTSAYLLENKKNSIKAFIAVGCRSINSKRLSCTNNMAKIKNIKVLDIWGDANKEDKDEASKRKSLVSKDYKQVAMLNANHVLDGANEFFVEEVESWLEQFDED